MVAGACLVPGGIKPILPVCLRKPWALYTQVAAPRLLNLPGLPEDLRCRMTDKRKAKCQLTLSGDSAQNTVNNRRVLYKSSMSLLGFVLFIAAIYLVVKSPKKLQTLVRMLIAFVVTVLLSIIPGAILRIGDPRASNAQSLHK